MSISRLRAISVACAKEMKPDEVFDNLPTIIVTRRLLPTDRVVAQGLMRTRPGMKAEPHVTTVDANTNS